MAHMNDDSMSSSEAEARALPPRDIRRRRPTGGGGTLLSAWPREFVATWRLRAPAAHVATRALSGLRARAMVSRSDDESSSEERRRRRRRRRREREREEGEPEGAKAAEGAKATREGDGAAKGASDGEGSEGGGRQKHRRRRRRHRRDSDEDESGDERKEKRSRRQARRGSSESSSSDRGRSRRGYRRESEHIRPRGRDYHRGREYDRRRDERPREYERPRPPRPLDGANPDVDRHGRARSPIRLVDTIDDRRERRSKFSERGEKPGEERKRTSNWDVAASASGADVQMPQVPPQLMAETRQARRLYVGNVPTEIGADELVTFFNEQMRSSGLVKWAGPAVTTTVHKGVGFCFLELRDVDETTAMLMFDGVIFKDRRAFFSVCLSVCLCLCVCVSVSLSHTPTHPPTHTHAPTHPHTCALLVHLIITENSATSSELCRRA